MKKRIMSLMFALVMCVGLAVPGFSMTMNETDVDPSIGEEDVSEEAGCYALIQELYGTVQSDAIEVIGEKISEENFGGIYRDDNGNLVVNVVDLGQAAEICSSLDSQSADKVKFEKVKYSLDYLEKAVDMLVPYMKEYSIITLDADDQTNELVICITDVSEDNITQLLATIESMSIPPECVKIIRKPGVKIQASVKKIDAGPSAETAASNPLERSVNGIMPGGVITAGNYSYTLGPYRNNRFYTAAHMFPLWTNITYRFGNDPVAMVIGQSTNSRFSGSTDIAVITPNSGCGQSDIISYGFANPIVGDRVTALGAASAAVGNNTSGKVTGLNVQVYLEEYNKHLTLACGDYLCISGDSGAAIFNNFSSIETITTCYGVHSSREVNEDGTLGYSCYFTTAQNMII